MTRPGRSSAARRTTRCGPCSTTVTDSDGPTGVEERAPLRPSLSSTSIKAVWRRSRTGRSGPLQIGSFMKARVLIISPRVAGSRAGERTRAEWTIQARG